MKNKVLYAAVAVLLALALLAAGFAAGFFTNSCSRSPAVRSYEWFLKTVDDNYYYGNSDGFEGMSLKGLAEKYLDRYSAYYTAEEFAAQQKSNAGSKSGLGISYSFIEGKGIYIASVTGNSPAYKEGLRAGEILVSGSAGGIRRDFTAADDFTAIVGAAGEGEMSFTAADGDTYTVSKSEYTASYAYMSTKSSSWIFGDAKGGGLSLYEKPSETPFLPEDIAYIQLSQFFGTAAEEFGVLVEKYNASGCTSLIIDLRSNGGGYVSVMQDIAGCFAGGEVKHAMLSRSKKGRTIGYNCARTPEKQRVKKGTRVYVLANSGTASASEALIGAMICYGALDYSDIYLSDYSDEYLENIGSDLTARTYGKGIMQSTFVNRSTGEALKLTTAQIYWPDGKTCIHERGITAADGCKKVPAAWQHTKGDEELKLAVEMIK